MRLTWGKEKSRLEFRSRVYTDVHGAGYVDQSSPMVFQDS